ncbi:hypothetical protein [Rufibacter roseus]|uniref:Uncharacterized protein n=1 Tax=Rufibacter roseus TaxID=1567108 RepID=A0ABW2DUJ0_9BACT|nr:hypothetical protein [Rufibacter roseus]
MGNYFNREDKGKQLVWQLDAGTAYTKDQKKEPGAFMASCYIEPTLYVRKVSEAWLEFPELVMALPEFAKENEYNHRNMLHVELKPYGKSMVQTKVTVALHQIF